MGKIFCLLGKSSCGKDTIFKELEKEKSLDLKPVVSYTTRPRRSQETQGLEYNFIDENILEEYIRNGKVIEKRDYNTVKGKWTYCTVDDGQIDLKDNNYLIIATLESYSAFQEYYGRDVVVPIYIEVDDGIRLQRALDREKMQKNPNYDEMCRRFLADAADFSESNLNKCEIHKRYNNDDFEKCVNEIKMDILKIK